jgi:hypothetical protein
LPVATAFISYNLQTGYPHILHLCMNTHTQNIGLLWPIWIKYMFSLVVYYVILRLV